MNPDILARYAANRLRVVRQVRYSLHNENCIDLVLFLNGIPVATAELKTDFTQSVDDAIDQYRFDRHPAAQGAGAPSRCCRFPSGALVHFAVSNSEVHMTTQAGRAGHGFLPFNQGDDGGDGQPAQPATATAPPTCGSRSGQREAGWRSSAAISSRSATRRSRSRAIIFPRYHQLDATRKLQAAVLAEGPGGKYLDPALGRLGQDELDRVDGALPGRPARRAATRSCSTRCWSSPTAT